MSQTLRRRVATLLSVCTMAAVASIAAPGAANADGPVVGSLHIKTSGLNALPTVDFAIEADASTNCPAGANNVELRINGAGWDALPHGYGTLQGNAPIDSLTGGGNHPPNMPSQVKLSVAAADNGVVWAAGKYTLSMICFDAVTFAEVGRLTGTMTFTDAAHWVDGVAAVKVAIKARTAPALLGVFKVGKRVSVKAATWTVSRVTVKYQWVRDGKSIRGATKTSYLLVKADKGHRVTVVVRASKTGYISAKLTPRAKKVA